MEKEFVMEVCKSCGRRNVCGMVDDLVNLDQKTPLIIKDAGCRNFTTEEVAEKEHDCANCTATGCPSHPSNINTDEEETSCEDCENCEHREECQKFNENVEKYGFEGALKRALFNDLAEDIVKAMFGKGSPNGKKGEAVVANSVLQGVMRGVQRVHDQGKPVNIVRMNTNTARVLVKDLGEAGIVFNADIKTSLPTDLTTPFGKVKIMIEEDIEDMAFRLGLIV